ncbi:family 43 glycosylhydrolase [Lacrimispora xylanisolvens]|uniref:family 43 glycosylhydrolase n=1 Tax=Lacrimispora xylanisolvens TaxID=384636 RepID=UPI0024028284
MNLYTSKTEVAAKQTFEAAKRGEYDTVLHLIDHSFNIEDCDEEGNSLLHYAVEGRNQKLVKYLVERCSMDPTWANQSMYTPYDMAEGTPLEDYFKDVCGFSRESCYRNPVLRGMHPDPSIVRVGEDYYMVNSSFIFFPCIPISHSKDLIHWETIGYGVTDANWAKEHLGKLDGGRGFWAPDISYHNGRFYICATLRNNDDAPFIQTQMVTSSENPAGPYETPIIHNVLGIDPSIFTDDDEKRYMLLNRGARIMEISADGKKLLSMPELIWYGHSGHAPEGPHLIKKDGYYYCFLAEGGTGKGHMITVARSENLYGPYESCPYNPIMHQWDDMGVIQCCGHGKPVQTPDGRWFMVYLSSRFIDGTWGMLGRETCLDEITWTADGWPVVNGRKGPSYMAPSTWP